MRYRTSPATTLMYPNFPISVLDKSTKPTTAARWYHCIILSSSFGLFCTQHFLAVLELIYHRGNHRGTYRTLESHVLRILGVTEMNPLSVPAFMFLLLCFISSSVHLVLQGTAAEWWLVEDINGDRALCFFRLCGPQSLADSDQGFSLCCGLVLFWCEIGPDFLSRAVRVARRIGIMLQSIREHAQADIQAMHVDPRIVFPAMWKWVKTSGEAVWDCVRRIVKRPSRVAQWPGVAFRNQPDLEQRWKELSEEQTMRESVYYR